MSLRPLLFILMLCLEAAAKPLSAEQARLLGAGGDDGRRDPTHYTRVPFEKPPGTIRIGIFGPSIACPSEVAPHLGIASLLEERFRRSGRGHVRVVAFCRGAASLHHSHMALEFAGRPRSLDAAVFVTPWLTPDRDSHFLYGGLPLHGRYVLDGADGVRLVPPAGDPRSLFPRYANWRYDLRTPPLLAALLPGVFATNPFYYRKDVHEELVELAARLLERAARWVPRVVVYTPHNNQEALAERLRGTAVEVLGSAFPARDLGPLYLRPRSHLSAEGNRLRAGELFHYLIGDEGFRETVYHLEPKSSPLPGTLFAAGRPLARVRPKGRVVGLSHRLTGELPDGAPVTDAGGRTAFVLKREIRTVRFPVPFRLSLR